MDYKFLSYYLHLDKSFIYRERNTGRKCTRKEKNTEQHGTQV